MAQRNQTLRQMARSAPDQLGRYSATTGTSSAAARWRGPVSPPTKMRARRMSAMSCPIGATQLKCITAARATSLPVPVRIHRREAFTSVLMLCAASALATSPNRSGGHCFAPHPAPGIDDRVAGNSQPGNLRICPGFCRGIYRKLRSKQLQFAAAKNWLKGLTGQRQVLFDHMFALDAASFLR